jgi:hypothetical protein
MASDVVVDLGQVRFIDSTGLDTSVGAAREAEATSITLRVRWVLRPQVARLPGPGAAQRQPPRPRHRGRVFVLAPES